MTRMKASDFDREVLDLFDGYVHGDISRREFLDRAKRYTVGGVTAAALLESLNPKYAEAQQVTADDKRLKTEYVEYDSPRGYGKVKAQLARPAGSTVLVPLCGKSRDLLWLAQHDFRVTGIEISPIAVEGFFRENGLEAERTVEAYGRALELLHDFLEARDVQLVTRITEDQLQGFWSGAEGAGK